MLENPTITYKYHNVRKENIKWEAKPLTTREIVFAAVPEKDFPSAPLPPIEYFLKYFSTISFDDMAHFTNLFAQQNNTKNWTDTNASEMKVFIGIHLYIGIIGLPRVIMYWQPDYRINIIADNMTKNRFFELRTNFHVQDNLLNPTHNSDKFFKVRPLYNSIKKRCNELHIEKNLCIDEQMVPFKGHLGLKQYMRGKPSPWGIKLYLLCGAGGMVYDLLLYQGSNTELDQETKAHFGLGGSVVLKLCEQLKKNRHILYFDNFFTSYNLLNALQDQKIYAAGTARVNRFANPPLIPDKHLRNMGRGASFEVTGSTEYEGRTNQIGIIKWFDNKGVVLASNFLTSGNTDEVNRWDKKEKKYITLERPEIVKLYNKSMGGVDIHDQLISYFRIFIRSRKWTLRMVTHSFDMALTNSWMEYRNDASHCNIQKKMDLLLFKQRVAKTLISLGRSQMYTPERKKKVGRPSSSPSPPLIPIKSRKPRNIDDPNPYNEIRYDCNNHFAIFDGRQHSTRCKYEKCTLKTSITCTKCNVHLCMTKQNNCFHKFHHNE